MIDEWTADQVTETQLWQQVVLVEQLPRTVHILPLTHHLQRRICALDRALLVNCSSPVRLCPYLQPYFELHAQDRIEGGCVLRMRDLQPVPDPVPQNNKSVWCMLIATYNPAPVPGNPLHIPLMQQFLPAWLASIKSSLTRYTFMLYVGSQVDGLWDDPAAKTVLLRHLQQQFEGLDIHVRYHRYALNPGLRDIVWKYNQLARQAYADGCTYLYQFSDDAAFQTPGWPEALAAWVDEHAGFGTMGVRDLKNDGTMTLGASGRTHMAIQGWFWPPRFKNWYADDFIQWVYGPKYSRRFANYSFINTQVKGQRYEHCLHQRAFHEELNRARYTAWRWSLTHQPNISQDLKTLLDQGVQNTKTLALNADQVADPACPGQETLSWDSLDQFV